MNEAPAVLTLPAFDRHSKHTVKYEKDGVFKWYTTKNIRKLSADGRWQKAFVWLL